jgi:sulfur carrier protein
MSGPSGASIAIRVNGEPQSCASGASVADLVASLGLRTELVAVEVNGAVVRRAEHATRRLAEGDEIEVVTLVGGG